MLRGRDPGPAASDTARMGQDQVCGGSLGKTCFHFWFLLLYGWVASKGLGARLLPPARQSPRSSIKVSSSFVLYHFTGKSLVFFF